MKNLCRRFSGRNNRFFHQEGIDGDFPGRFSETGDAMLNRNLDKLFAYTAMRKQQEIEVRKMEFEAQLAGFKLVRR